MQEVDDLNPLSFRVEGDFSNRAALVRIKSNNAAFLNISGFCENNVCIPDEIIFTEEYLDAVFYTEVRERAEIGSLTYGECYTLFAQNPTYFVIPCRM